MRAITKFALLIVLLASLSFTNCTKDDVVVKGIEISFEDPNLEQAIRDIIDKPEGIIYLDDVKYIEEMDLYGHEITDLTGIEFFTSLTTLDLGNNLISDLTPLTNLTNLTLLNLAENSISTLTPLINLTNLTYLNLRFNLISDVEYLLNLTNLTHLYLCDNQIIHLLDFSALTHLQELTLANNFFQDVAPLCKLGTGFDGMIAFFMLDINDQQIQFLQKCLPNANIVVTLFVIDI